MSTLNDLMIVLMRFRIVLMGRGEGASSEEHDDLTLGLKNLS